MGKNKVTDEELVQICKANDVVLFEFYTRYENRCSINAAVLYIQEMKLRI
jgi:hypothetical protein